MFSHLQCESTRIRLYGIPPEFILSVFRPGDSDFVKQVTIDDLPEDAKVIGVHYDFERNLFLMKVESKHFKEVPQGNLLPVTIPRVNVVRQLRV